jgi:carboxymethylenebutenolidase
MTNTSRHTLELTDGRSLQLTVAEPEGSVRAGVVVFHEAGGVTDTVLAQLSWLADEGWLAVTPHIYRQPDDADAGAEASTLTSESVLADADATCVWLGQHGVPDDMIGVVGFGLGGTAAMLVAASRTVGAAVSVAPHDRAPATAALPALDELAAELACPWLGVFDERDGRVDADEVDSLREAATASEIATEVVRLPGASKHFDAEPDSRTQAWQRTVNWFDSNLR